MRAKIIRKSESQVHAGFSAAYGYMVLFCLGGITHALLASIVQCCAILSRALLLFNSQAEIQKQSQSNPNRMMGLNFISKTGM